MKQLLLCVGICILSIANSGAQSFTVAHDTVMITSGGPSLSLLSDSVVNGTTGAVPIGWRVVATNFPADWKGACSGFCDPNICYTWSDIMDSTQRFTLHGAGDEFHLSIDFGCTTSYGCYYTVVRMHNIAAPADTATETYLVCTPAPAGVLQAGAMAKPMLYPNPASDELDIIADAAMGIATAAVYSTTGRLMSISDVAAGACHIGLRGMAAGMYFVKMMNGHGEVMSIQKFIKQ